MEIKLVDKVELIDIDSIKPYENNPKEHPDDQIKKIKKSIREYGFTVPILIDKEKNIIAGHARYLVAKELNIKSIPCIIRDDLNESEIKAFRIADNKVAESSWNIELLTVEFEELKYDGYDLSNTGFDKEELENLIYDEDPEESTQNTGGGNNEHNKIVCPRCGFELGEI